MIGGGARPWRSGRIDGAAWTLYDAARAPSGLGLGYFFCDDPDVADRRAALPAGLAVSDLDEEAFRALWETGRPLTSTERRVVDGSGAIWLAQGTGPVWAEGGSAAGTIGVRVRCVSTRRPVVELNGATLSGMSDAELIARLGAPEGVAPSSD
ncbi:MAG: hypothetical protein F4164_00050 [Gemmatimonadales bacterium]|nr:hypothetical protein [Gemmatimonadales bacterium]MYG47771.1 hypothetical protein [Gemmatimonadales bacterium]MYK02647.1 hypothetical protein [Candidatus Palauibacter ramosifaciens]